MSNPLTGTFRTALAEVVDLIPRKIRTALYVTAVVVALVAFAVQRAAAIWFPELDARVDATVAEVVTGCLFVIGLLAFTHRPTRAQLLPVAPDALDIAAEHESRARAIDTLVHAGWNPEAAAKAVAADDLTLLHKANQ